MNMLCSPWQNLLFYKKYAHIICWMLVSISKDLAHRLSSQYAHFGKQRACSEMKFLRKEESPYFLREDMFVALHIPWELLLSVVTVVVRRTYLCTKHTTNTATAGFCYFFLSIFSHHFLLFFVRFNQTRKKFVTLTFSQSLILSGPPHSSYYLYDMVVYGDE